MWKVVDGVLQLEPLDFQQDFKRLRSLSPPPAPPTSTPPPSPPCVMPPRSEVPRSTVADAEQSPGRRVLGAMFEPFSRMIGMSRHPLRRSQFMGKVKGVMSLVFSTLK